MLLLQHKIVPMKRLTFFSALILILLSSCGGNGNGNQEAAKSQASNKPHKLIPIEEIKTKYGDGLYAQMRITEGDVLIRLEMERAPLTTANFVALAEGKMPNTAIPVGQPFYDGLNFHRVISIANGDNQNFMIQGGDPKGDGTGGPGYQFRNEISPALTHYREGTLAMANSGPNTNGSQFYITVAPQSSLDGSYNVFGYVVQGQDNVNKTLKGDKIRYVEIRRVGAAAENFDAVKTFNDLK